MVKNLPVMQEPLETWVGSLGQEDPLEDSMATHSSILARKIPTDRGAWWATAHRVTKSHTRLKRLGTQTQVPHTCGVKQYLSVLYTLRVCSVASDSLRPRGL